MKEAQEDGRRKLYMEAGVKIRRGYNLEIPYRHILPAFVGMKPKELQKNVHFYQSWEELFEAYPNVEDEFNGAPSSEKNIRSNDPLERYV